MPIDHAFIGHEFPAKHYEIGREKIREYVRAVGDLNPLYLDEQAGRTSPYGDMVGPPALASQYTLLAAEQLVTDPAVGVDLAMLVHLDQEYRFFRLVRPGDRLRINGRIKHIYERRSLQFVVFETSVSDERGDPVTMATSTYVIRPRQSEKA